MNKKKNKRRTELLSREVHKKDLTKEEKLELKSLQEEADKELDNSLEPELEALLSMQKLMDYHKMAEKSQELRDKIANKLEWKLDTKPTPRGNKLWRHPNGASSSQHPVSHSLDTAFGIFEELCKPKGWDIFKNEFGWYACLKHDDRIYSDLIEDDPTDIFNIICHIIDIK